MLGKQCLHHGHVSVHKANDTIGHSLFLRTYKVKCKVTICSVKVQSEIFWQHSRPRCKGLEFWTCLLLWVRTQCIVSFSVLLKLLQKSISGFIMTVVLLYLLPFFVVMYVQSIVFLLLANRNGFILLHTCITNGL